MMMLLSIWLTLLVASPVYEPAPRTWQALESSNHQKLMLIKVSDPMGQQAGLMHVKKMAHDQGMLFIFDHPQTLAFWMKNTHISLDMIFLNQRHIVKQYQQVPSCKSSICPVYIAHQADSCIELSAGMAKILGWKIGDTLHISDNKI